MENDQSNLQIVPVGKRDGTGIGTSNDDKELPPGFSVSKFDYSVENYFKAMHKMSRLSGESEFDCDESEIQRMSSSVSFLREWKHICFKPQAITFACQGETQRKDVIGGVNLTQFSSAAVPVSKDVSDGIVPSHLSKDFVMCVGGLIWALDWCPRAHRWPNCDVNLEFIAVAAHPPESSYHKIGAPLTGRGVIQIWGLLNHGVKDDDVIPHFKRKPKKNSSNKATGLEQTQPKRPRGRPRKNAVKDSVQLDQDSTNLLHTDGISKDTHDQVVTEDTDTIVKSSALKKPRGRPKKKPLKEAIDNIDTGKEHLILKCSEDPSNMNKVDIETPENVFKEDTCRYQNAHVRVLTEKHQHTMVTEIINFNLIKPIKPKRSVRVRKKRMKDCASSLDDIDQDAQPLSVVFPEVLNKVHVHKTSVDTPEIVVEKESSINQHALHSGVAIEVPQQVPRGSVTKVVKLRERQKPKKKLTDEAIDDSNCSIPHVEAIAFNLNEEAPKVICDDGISSKMPKQVTKEDPSKKRKSCDSGYPELPVSTASKSSFKKCKLMLKGQETATGLSLISQNGRTSPLDSDSMKSIDDKAIPVVLEAQPDSYYISEDVALPRLAMCLAHNGKVAWDVKWRPFNSCFRSKHRMGYLGVLLGSGALEVWEVPLPHAVEAMFSSSQKEGTDPRFIKLEPVFRCSMLKCGDRQSIPLTMEWSTSAPHDLILAGCHDGVVALWKFSANGPLKDTRPLLCFSADTVPIRALAWAPVMSDSESTNIVVTAGHKGVKFWDIRDPFRPIWDLNHIQRTIYGLDWLHDPRCVALSSDDGEIRIISLLKAACDVPVTGTPFVGTQLQGLHSYHCSSSSIWSLHVSRRTGMVAYCCSDGTVLHFQLTIKAVEKDPRRNREPHYLCGALTVEGSNLTVFSPIPDVPFPMKKSSNEWSDTPRSRRGFLAVSNQEKRAKEQIAKSQPPEEQMAKSQPPEEQMAKSQTPEEQPLALCYGNEPSNDSGSDDTLTNQKSEHTSKTKHGTEKNPKTDSKKGSKCKDECVDIENEEKEAFPPKIVAMHRVRWNMNKGSERWLCYGGAAGILRCQEIRLPGT